MIKNKIPFRSHLRKLKENIRRLKVFLIFKVFEKKVVDLRDVEEVINNIRNGNVAKFFIDQVIGEFLKSDNIVKEADEICLHNFDLLGSGTMNLGKKINWHCDFKSGHCWNPKTFYLDIKYGDNKGVDVKAPWELSRFQHFSALGQAYYVTKNEKYAKEFIYEVEDWIDNNPFLYGVNWKCTMDVSIRACNWIMGFYFFKDSPEMSEEFLKKFIISLIQHGKYIENNLERSFFGFASNHYLADIAGMIHVGMFMKDLDCGKGWLKFGIGQLIQEMKNQVYSDGCDCEASTYYHRLVLELFFFSTLLVVINDENFNGVNHKEITEKIFGGEYYKKLYKMFEAVSLLLKPNGQMPQIGDNDNGRLYIFQNDDVRNVEYILKWGDLFFNDSFFLDNRDALLSHHFPVAGWYVMRNNKDYCLVSCGPNGQEGNGGHSHNDKLSLELYVGEKDVIVDPGCYVYTPYPEERNKFRSTLFHNTVSIDGEEQNSFTKSNLFSLKDNSKAKCLKWETDGATDFFEGEHYGYKRLHNPVVHNRKIKFFKLEKKLEITDMFSGIGKHSIEWNFYFKNKADVKLILDQEIDWIEDRVKISSSYGSLVAAQRLNGKYYGNIDRAFKFTIQW